MKSKNRIFILLIIFSIVLISIFLILYYKNSKNGNTMINKSEEEIVKNILSIKCYEAKLDITVETNKNKTNYRISQVLQNNIATQEVLEPQNIAGVITEYDGNNLKIKNSKLDLETIFENYQYMANNRLWLNSFIEDYQKESNTVLTNSNENEIILEVKTQENQYNFYKKLYIDKKTGKPTKMIVQDINQKTVVYILYTEMTIS